MFDRCFNVGDIFIYDGSECEITRIDYEDEEYPYECYPVKIIVKARKVADKKGECVEDILNDRYIDERICLSEYDIEWWKHRNTEHEMKKIQVELNKEIRRLKAELKKQPRLIRLVLTDEDGDWDEDDVYYLINPDESKLDKLLQKDLNMNDPADYVFGYVKRNFKTLNVETCEIKC